MPDRDYYLKDDARNQNIRSEYVKYITDMFKLVGDDDATARRKAQNILALETALAKAQLSRVELRDPVKTYNKFSVADFSKTTSGLDWSVMLTSMKVSKADSILCNNPTFFKTANSLLSAVPLESWKAYLQWAIIKNTAGYLSSDFVNRQFQFYMGVDNVLDTHPPYGLSGTGSPTADSASRANATAAIYDAFGRKVYAGFRARF